MSSDDPNGDPFRKEPPPAAPPPPPSGGGAASGHPYGDNPYGGAYGAADPLAGMPPLASRGKRLVARIIDGLLIGVPVFLILGLSTGGTGFSSTDSQGGQYAQGLVFTVIYLLYEGFMLTTRGQTVGKMAMKIRVAMLDSGALPAGNAGWFRAGVYSLPAVVPCLGTLFWLVNVLFCTWDKPYQQCLHDKVAKTVVVAA